MKAGMGVSRVYGMMGGKHEPGVYGAVLVAQALETSVEEIWQPVCGTCDGDALEACDE